MELNNVIQAAAVTGIVKPIIDATKKTPIPTPSWSIVPLVLLLGIVIAFLLAFAGGNKITSQSIAVNILTGLSGGLGAIAATELGRSADRQSLEEKNEEK